MTAASAEVHQALREADWPSLTPKLQYYAACHMRAQPWLGIPGGPLPGGKDVNDLIHQVIAKTLSGERQWDPRRVPLLTFLLGAIRGEISNLAQSMENKRTRRATPICQGSDARSGALDPSQYPDDRSLAGGEDALVSARYDQEKQEILGLLSTDPLVCRIAELIIEDEISSPRRLAAMLDTDVQSINNAKKRLRRWLLSRWPHYFRAP